VLARASPVKETPVKNAAKTSFKPTRGNELFSTESQRPENEFTAPKFSWSIGNVAISAPSDGARNPGDHGGPTPAARPSAGLPWPIHAKIEVGAVDDPLEREADRVAEQVVRMPDHRLQRKCACGGTCSECSKQSSEQEHSPVRMKHIGPAGPALTETPLIVHEVLRSPGQPLDAATHALMEPRFGHDFSHVRVHTGPRAEESASEVNAHAYTAEHNIVFGRGQFAPHTSEGRRLLAHELTHVVQQSGGVSAIQREPDRRWIHDENFARYRGKIMAARIKIHGKLSKEARAKIDSELAYFEGSARDSYLQLVLPALRSVTEPEMPPMDVSPKPPEPPPAPPTDTHTASVPPTAPPPAAEDRNFTKQHLWDLEFKREHPENENIGRIYGTRDEGVMTEVGIRVPLYKGNFLARRHFYERKRAEQLAWEGFIHYAELAEAGLDTAARTDSLLHGTLAPLRDDQIDLDQVVGWSWRAMIARQGVQLALAAAEVANTYRGAAADVRTPNQDVAIPKQEPDLPTPKQESVIVQGSSTDATVVKGTSAMAARTGQRATTLGKGNLVGVDEVTVVAHANETAVQIGNQILTPKQLAQGLADSGFEGGTVRLAACKTAGCGSGGKAFAQELSKELRKLSKDSAVIGTVDKVVIPSGIHAAQGLPTVISGSKASRVAKPLGKGWEIFVE
jgi:hypothetical protein